MTSTTGSRSIRWGRGARHAAIWIGWLAMGAVAFADQPGAADSTRSPGGAGGATTAAATRNEPSAATQTSDAEALRRDPRVWRLNQIVLWSVVLLLVFCVGAAAVVHFSRRYRTYLLRERSQPTPDDDVWAMHRLPPERPSGEGEAGGGD
ncbi:MAG: hypothetical protein HBSAPP02_08800 [Phycisphaerae bacterium]|nr:MAG: hypothetical protein HRU71_13315 [Planctomycetia bacterium]RIK71548.1 MAG: hypothetical protein DCC66_01010 [Planctomycetota bacterium]GJQ25848.1 MAG: hypothetical protein HBSAPP02_08800 [Phycisphaerae bacterium]